MDFSKVASALDEGKKIKRSFWKNAYWYLNADKEIMNHDEEGKEFPMKTFPMAGVMWAMADDWEIVEEAPAKDEERPETEYSFGVALFLMKSGNKMARKGWNGKGQYIQLATNISYKTVGGEVVNCNHEAIGNQAIAFVGTSGVQMGWLASQADMLAKDWICVD